MQLKNARTDTAHLLEIKEAAPVWILKKIYTLKETITNAQCFSQQ